MHVLIVKLSSMGDVIHTLPAVCDAVKIYPNIRFDWAVEENFQEIPHWNSAITRVIPIQLRKWRKHPLASSTRDAIRKFWQEVTKLDYDLIIDAQGLIKSALVSKMASGLRVGYDSSSAREGGASFLYSKRFDCSYNQHAIDRIRKLFSFALEYQTPDLEYIDYGLSPDESLEAPEDKSIIFFHGASGNYKLWLEAHWIELGRLFQSEDYRILLPWGSHEEYLRALRIAKQLIHVGAEVLPRLSLGQLRQRIVQSDAVISVDTGLAHLTAALNKLNYVLYSDTDPLKIGTRGANQYHLRMGSITPQQIFKQFMQHNEMMQDRVIESALI